MLIHPDGKLDCNGMSTFSRSYSVRRGSDIGAAIAEARHARGLTQAELASELGVGRAYLAAMETGRTNRLIEHLLRALRRLGAEVTIAWPTTNAERTDG